MANYIHWKICKYFEIDTKSKYYERQPQNVINMRKGTILWDKTIFTDRETSANRPDIIVHNKGKKSCLIIDISVPDDPISSKKKHRNE